MDLKHDILQDIRRIAIDLQATPNRDQYRSLGKFSDRQMRVAYGSFSLALIAAGLQPSKYSRDTLSVEKTEKQKKFKWQKPKLMGLGGHFLHVLDLPEMFEAFGNPPSIKMIAQPDTHLEDKDDAAHDVFCQFANFYDPHIHMIMGDFLNVGGLSPWPQRDLDPKRIVPEALAGRLMLAHYKQKVMPNAKRRIYLTGNHEDWIVQFLSSGNNSQLFDGIEELGLDITLDKLLSLPEMGYESFPVNHIVGIGLANFTHGLYAGNNHARKHLSAIKANIYYGHTHDLQSCQEASLHGMVEAHSLACLCRLDADFLRGKPNNWAHAVSVFEFFPDGDYTFYCLRIINGKLSFMGRIFSA